MRTTRVEEIPAGMVREFQLEGVTIALGNVDGKFFAINNVCLHRGGPLGGGELEGKVVTCPWHAWQYDITNGRVCTNPEVGVETYPVEVRGEDIFVDIG